MVSGRRAYHVTCVQRVRCHRETSTLFKQTTAPPYVLFFLHPEELLRRWRPLSHFMPSFSSQLSSVGSLDQNSWAGKWPAAEASRWAPTDRWGAGASEEGRRAQMARVRRGHFFFPEREVPAGGQVFTYPVQCTTKYSGSPSLEGPRPILRGWQKRKRFLTPPRGKYIYYFQWLNTFQVWKPSLFRFVEARGPKKRSPGSDVWLYICCFCSRDGSYLYLFLTLDSRCSKEAVPHLGRGGRARLKNQNVKQANRW